MKLSLPRYQFIILILTVLMSIILPVAVEAQEDGTQTFDTADLSGWEHSPDVAITEGVLRIHPGNFALRFGDLDNPIISLRVKYSVLGEAVIGYAFRDEGRYILRLGEGHATLVREIGESGTDLARSESSALTPDAWIQVQITVNGGEHTVAINGESVLTATDPDPLQPGPLFLHASGEDPVEFDDLALVGIVAPSEQAVPPVEQAPPPAPTPDSVTAALGSDPGTRNLVQAFFTSQASQLELTTFLINLLLAAFCAYILSRVYIHWGASLSNRRRFAANLMLITITTTFIILVVRSSVALSLGLVGALSIVRFRTAIKEPEELAYLFFAIAIGIGLGDNQRLFALVALAAVVVIIGIQQLTRQTQADVNLHLTIASHMPTKVEVEQVVSALKPHCVKWKLLRCDENDSVLEVAFLIEFRNLDNFVQAKADLRALSESLEISFLDNRGLW